MISGFISTTGSSKRVIIRALGPSLQSSNVPDPLADPDERQLAAKYSGAAAGDYEQQPRALE
jgi:hypothetical protein